MVIERMKVRKQVKKSRREQTGKHVHVMVNNSGEKIECNSTTGCELCEEKKRRKLK